MSFDWSNPDSWKPSTDLVTDWKTIGTFALAIGGALWRWGGRLRRWLISKLRRAKTPAPTAPPTADHELIFVIDEHRTTYGPLGAGERTGTHVHGVWDVTNVSDRTFVLLKVKLGDRTAIRPGAIGVQRPDGTYELKGALPAHQMSTVLIELTFTPAIHPANEDLIADVMFTDNYGNEHKLSSVRFRRRGPLSSPSYALSVQSARS
jgi:hypothetical protein